MKTTLKFDCRRQSDLSKLLCTLKVGAAAGVLVRLVDLPLLFSVGGLLSTIDIVALSLGISTVMVVAHHAFRIFGSMFIAAGSTKATSCSFS